MENYAFIALLLKRRCKDTALHYTTKLDLDHKLVAFEMFLKSERRHPQRWMMMAVMMMNSDHRHCAATPTYPLSLGW